MKYEPELHMLVSGEDVSCTTPINQYTLYKRSLLSLYLSSSAKKVPLKSILQHEVDNQALFCGSPYQFHSTIAANHGQDYLVEEAQVLLLYETLSFHSIS
jgi:hypothetical protein